MRVFRIAKKQYLEDLSGEGSRLFGGRWNKKGMAMLYFSDSLSTSLLEVLVHLDFKHLTNDFGYIEIEIPDALIDTKLKLKDLNDDWRDNPPRNSTVNLGSAFLKANKKLGLKVPCTILPMASNILINPRHKDISKIKVIKVEDLDIDSRLVVDGKL
ncbi:RES family NAD+ phosphorylase [Lacinutrix sp. Bg11-31]|uniref:RES family NAD+ phosphorylase n=1 Tax=Lacinutrix sp. Bg11-31 TaxID=2057808 RepID=UPI000C315679|nr:RES family NAD+ phosphorylase [Lacinutrix sp. Bg11-31]AUC82207.1 RES superfamily protein [Lacinutrix sp. Bg11-31]